MMGAVRCCRVVLIELDGDDFDGGAAHTVHIFFPRYHCVQSALTQQNSELQDTRMLTEFLERVELEESQELSGGQYSLGQVRPAQRFEECS